MNVFELFGTIAINNEQANKALSDTGKQANGLSRTMESAFGKLQSTAVKIGAAVASAFAIGKIKDFGQECSQVYASVAAEQAAFGQIMGDYAVMANEKMKSVAEETGMVSTRLMPYMTSMTAKFKGLGYGVDEATSLAQEGLMIAADASAFWDKSLDESMSHLNSFINGSYEGGEAIGLFANDTQMAAYALKNGIIKETKAWAQLDEATKQSTRLQYAKEMMASSGATGQAAKEADAYANVQANLNEQFRQFKAVIGEPIMQKMILPGMQLISKLMPGITEKTEALAASFERGFDLIASYFTDVFTEDGINLEALPKAFEKMFGDIVKKAPALLTKVGNAIKTTWKNRVWPGVQSLFKAAFGVELPSWDKIVEKISYGWNSVVFPKINGFFEKQFGITLPTSWEELVSDVKTAWETNVFPKISGFFEKQFGITLPASWEGLISDIKTAWDTNVKPNVDDFFKVMVGMEPTDVNSEGTAWATVLRNWFDKIANPETGAYAVVVDILTGEVSPDGRRWSAVIADWFHGIVEEVSEQLKITFTPEMPTEEEKAKFQNDLTLWLNGADGKSGVVGLIANAIAFPFDLAFQECMNIWENFQSWLVSIGETGKISTEVGHESEWALGAKYDYRLWGYGKEELDLLQKWIDAAKEAQRVEKLLETDSYNPEYGAAYKEATRNRDAAFKNVNDQLMSDYQSWLAGQVGADRGTILDLPASLTEGTEQRLQSEIDGMNLEASVKLYPDYSGMNGVSAALGGNWRAQPTIKWNAEGAVFKKPTIFNTRLGLQGVGESGAEMVSPVSVMQKYVADAVASQNAGMVTVMQSMLNVLNQINANTSAGNKVVLDSGVLVGQLAPALDTQLGTISTRKGRRN